MIKLTGTLRQASTVTYDEKLKTKMWIEHTSPRDNGAPDLKIEELFLDGDLTDKLPKAGAPITIVVRPYAQGRFVKFSAVELCAA